MSPGYVSARKHADDLHAAAQAAGQTLAQYPRGPLGLTPDDVKASPAWRADHAAYERAHAAARQFNAWFCKAFKTERAADRADRNARGLM